MSQAANIIGIVGYSSGETALFRNYWLNLCPITLVIPARFKWDDVGTWVALERLLLPNKNGNIIRGRHIGLETENCIIHTEDGLVATMGVKNLVIIQANNKILVGLQGIYPRLKKGLSVYVIQSNEIKT